MGMALRLYGCIVEYGLGSKELNDKVRRHNESVIQHIESSQYVYLRKDMFFINKKADSYCGRLIYFGGNSRDWMYSDGEKNWKMWVSEFETLLTRLYWLEADVHFKPEYASLQSFFWRIDLKRWSAHPWETIRPIRPSDWDVKGEIDWAK